MFLTPVFATHPRPLGGLPISIQPNCPISTPANPRVGQGRNPLFVSANSAYSVLIPIPSFDFRLSTSSIYPLSFHSLANSFALRKTLSHLFSGNSELFAQNTGGGRTPYREMHDFKGADSAGKASNGLNLLFTDHSELSTVNHGQRQETEVKLRNSLFLGGIEGGIAQYAIGPTSFSTSAISTMTMASHGQPSRKQPSGPLLMHFLQPMQR